MSVSPALKSWLSNPVYHMELGYTSGGNSEILFFKKTNKLTKTVTPQPKYSNVPCALVPGPGWLGLKCVSVGKMKNKLNLSMSVSQKDIR